MKVRLRVGKREVESLKATPQIASQMGLFTKSKHSHMVSCIFPIIFFLGKKKKKKKKQKKSLKFMCHRQTGIFGKKNEKKSGI